MIRLYYYALMLHFGPQVSHFSSDCTPLFHPTEDPKSTHTNPTLTSIIDQNVIGWKTLKEIKSARTHLTFNDSFIHCLVTWTIINNHCIESIRSACFPIWIVADSFQLLSVLSENAIVKYQCGSGITLCFPTGKVWRDGDNIFVRL